jgi:tetratricopeptide (TPR) repeat protein
MMNKLLIFITLIACAVTIVPASAQNPQSGAGLGGGPNSGPPITPAQKAAWKNSSEFSHKSVLALDAGQYASAISDAKQAVAIGMSSHDPIADTVLAYALVAEGKDQDALNEYGQMYARGDWNGGDLLQYAQLLLKHGLWSKAVDVYQKAVKDVGSDVTNGHELLVAESDFSHDDPQPKELESDIHIAIGMYGDIASNLAGKYRPERSLAEYKKALDLEPDSALAKLAYAKGLMKCGRGAEAQAEFREVANKYTGQVKAAAQQELGIYPPPPARPK